MAPGPRVKVTSEPQRLNIHLSYAPAVPRVDAGLDARLITDSGALKQTIAHAASGPGRDLAGARRTPVLLPVPYAPACSSFPFSLALLGSAAPLLALPADDCVRIFAPLLSAWTRILISLHVWLGIAYPRYEPTSRTSCSIVQSGIHESVPTVIHAAFSHTGSVSVRSVVPVTRLCLGTRRYTFAQQRCRVTHRPSSTPSAPTALERSRLSAARAQNLQHDGNTNDPRHDLEAATRRLWYARPSTAMYRPHDLKHAPDVLHDAPFSAPSICSARHGRSPSPAPHFSHFLPAKSVSIRQRSPRPRAGFSQSLTRAQRMGRPLPIARTTLIPSLRASTASSTSPTLRASQLLFGHTEYYAEHHQSAAGVPRPPPSSPPTHRGYPPHLHSTPHRRAHCERGVAERTLQWASRGFGFERASPGSRFMPGNNDFIHAAPPQNHRAFLDSLYFSHNASMTTTREDWAQIRWTRAENGGCAYGRDLDAYRPSAAYTSVLIVYQVPVRIRHGKSTTEMTGWGNDAGSGSGYVGWDCTP
ncbi:hypothetical protein K438DRAFT_1962040 [Mycena galopus ATCC 62051]|nr:hypothetical protein K438DRAFT_1962040 [Mycena galopus ATCC 62051]